MSRRITFFRRKSSIFKYEMSFEIAHFRRKWSIFKYEMSCRITVFSSKIIDFQIRNEQENRARNGHFPNRKSLLTENGPFSNTKWAWKSPCYRRKWSIWRPILNASRVKVGQQKGSSEISNRSSWTLSFENKVVKTLPTFRAQTDGRTDARTDIWHFSTHPQILNPRASRGAQWRVLEKGL